MGKIRLNLSGSGWGQVAGYWEYLGVYRGIILKGIYTNYDG